MYLAGEEEIEAIAKVIRSGKLFRYREDSECERFEKRYAKHLGVGEFATRVQAARLELGDRHQALLAVRRQRRLGPRLRLANQRGEAAAQPAALVQGDGCDGSGVSDVVGHCMRLRFGEWRMANGLPAFAIGH